MVVGARLAVGVVTALAVLVTVSRPTAPAGDRDAAVTSPAVVAPHIGGKVLPSGLSERVPRLVFSAPMRAPYADAIPLASALVCLGLVGPSRRRITDAGHDWRSLLVGAPPVLP